MVRASQGSGQCLPTATLPAHRSCCPCPSGLYYHAPQFSRGSRPLQESHVWVSGSPRRPRPLPQGRIPGALDLVFKTTCQYSADFSPKALSLHSVLSNYVTLGRSLLNSVLSRRNFCSHKCIRMVPFLGLSWLSPPERSQFDLTTSPLPSLFCLFACFWFCFFSNECICVFFKVKPYWRSGKGTATGPTHLLAHPSPPDP